MALLSLALAEGVLIACVDAKRGRIANELLLTILALNFVFCFIFKLEVANFISNITYWIVISFILHRSGIPGGDLKYTLLYSPILETDLYVDWFNVVILISILMGSLFRKISFPLAGLLSILLLSIVPAASSGNSISLLR